MIKKFFFKYKWLLIIMVGAFCLRAPGVIWGLPNHDGFQPDEAQHVGIARILINVLDKNIVEADKIISQYNARGFGTQLALIGYPILKIFKLSSLFLFFIGRLLSLGYSLVLIWLIYLIALYLFKNEKVALLSALLLAVFDLNVTYSHFGLPDVATVFWSYLAVFLIVIFYNKVKTDATIIDNLLSRYFAFLFFIPLACAMSFIFKFDVIPSFLFVIVLLLLFQEKKMSGSNVLKMILIFGMMFFGFAYVGTGFNYSLSDFLYSVFMLRTDNQNLIPRDRHLLLNPIQYLAAILAGTSFFVVLSGLLAAINLVRQKYFKDNKDLLFFASFCLLEFIVLWTGDATFVRRALIFLPLLAILASYYLVMVMPGRQSTAKIVVVTLVVLYTAGLTFVSQYHFLFDIRYQAKDFLLQIVKPGENIGYTHFSRVKGMPGKDKEEPVFTEKFLVMDEAYYSRYWKFFTNPFRVPQCCDESYHCKYDQCLAIQKIFSGTSNYELIKQFTWSEFFPERIIFKNIFGTYYEIIGDVLIYRQISAS